MSSRSLARGVSTSCGCYQRQHASEIGLIDLTGRKFGKWLVLERAGYSETGAVTWLCRCDCNKTAVVLGGNLRSGLSQSCGCVKTTHGHCSGGKESKAYKAWRGLVSRCTNENHPAWDNYGGRGIDVHPDFLDFETWLAEVGEPPNPDDTIDRIRNDLGYTYGNMRWTDWTTQIRNRRNTIQVEYKGRRMPLIEWAELLGLNYNSLKYRFYNGWDVERMLTTGVPNEKQQQILDEPDDADGAYDYGSPVPVIDVDAETDAFERGFAAGYDEAIEDSQAGTPPGFTYPWKPSSN